MPCRPDATTAASVRSSLPGATTPVQPTCAVVGSSDILRLDPRGPEIDAHAVVWRLNNAPTAGWEDAVGRRTSARLINHVPIEKWLLLARNRSALDRTTDGAEYHRLLCAPEYAPLGCVVSRANSGPGLRKTLDAYRARYASHRVALVSDALHRWGVRCNEELRGTQPSGGLYAVLAALASCRAPVSLYGFWPHCCQRTPPPDGRPAMHYKYFQGNRTRFVCCSRGRERMEVEYALYEQLHARGLVRLVKAPETLTGPAPRTRQRPHYGSRVVHGARKV